MLAWLKGAKSTKERYELSPVIASADRSVSDTLKQSGSASRKRKRSGNNSYSAEQRAQIADYARQNGNTASDISALYGRKSRPPNDVISA